MPADKISTPSLVRQVYGPAKRKLANLDAAEARLIHTPGLRSKHLAQFSRDMAKLDDEIAVVNTGPQSLTGITGRAGPGVKSVKFILADGQTVSAIVQHGWYEAWWPGSAKPNAANATRVRITTSSGKRSSKMAYGAIIASTGAKHCVNGIPCSVFATATLKQQIAPALKAHFALFENTEPASPSTTRSMIKRLHDGGRSTYAASLGVDDAQARLVKLTDRDALWIVPGTEGVCVTLIRTDGADGTCQDINSILNWGEADVSYFGREENGQLTGQLTYTLAGLLPNGNKTVSVRLATGATVTVPVHDNIIYKTFSTAVRWFRFRNGHGIDKYYRA
jgi:hypothetical protein